MQSPVAATQLPTSADITLSYHARTKHRLARYAAGPETLDWDSQPDPFREFSPCARTPLPLNSDHLDTSFAELTAPNGRVSLLSIASVATLLELSLGLSAWKQYGPDRWALRCNPSSGNLHPTEAYVIAANVAGLADGLYHYVSRDHALELRCRRAERSLAPPQLWIGLSSVHWREAWKYGERAFRYVQLDIGHALGAVRYAAAALGWRAVIVDDIDGAAIAARLGLDRAADFAGVEAEDAELLIAIDADPAAISPAPAIAPEAFGAADLWTGRANRLDPRPLYRWPVISEVAAATTGRGRAVPAAALSYPPLGAPPAARAANILLNRRSAQRFDIRYEMSLDRFYRLLDALLPRPIAPWDILPGPPLLHPLLLVHRVAGLEAGLYALPRDPEALVALRLRLRANFEWQRQDGAPQHLPLFRLLPADGRKLARTAHCHQGIASESCFALAMLSEFAPIVQENPWRYRRLHWEAGLLGHALYIEAEAMGLRGTGIGCYFDDAVHELFGLAGAQWQSLYHFTVGHPLSDDRITTEPGYPGRQRNER